MQYSPNIFQNNFSNIIEVLPEMESMITFYNKESADVVPFLDTEYDLAFIDGCHDYECVKADYEAVSKKVKKGGCIIFHDAVKTPSYKQGIWDVITEIKESNKKLCNNFYTMQQIYLNLHRDLYLVRNLSNFLNSEY